MGQGVSIMVKIVIEGEDLKGRIMIEVKGGRRVEIGRI